MQVLVTCLLFGVSFQVLNILNIDILSLIKGRLIGIGVVNVK